MIMYLCKQFHIFKINFRTLRILEECEGFVVYWYILAMVCFIESNWVKEPDKGILPYHFHGYLCILTLFSITWPIAFCIHLVYFHVDFILCIKCSETTCFHHSIRQHAHIFKLPQCLKKGILCKIPLNLLSIILNLSTVTDTSDMGKCFSPSTL